jgi:chemotaxis methyl-accepting protein methylase
VELLQSPVAGAAEFQEVTAELTIGETYFFRYHEQFGGRLAGWNVQIVGTDLNCEFLDRTRPSTARNLGRSERVELRSPNLKSPNRGLCGTASTPRWGPR